MAVCSDRTKEMRASIGRMSLVSISGFADLVWNKKWVKPASSIQVRNSNWHIAQRETGAILNHVHSQAAGVRGNLFSVGRLLSRDPRSCRSRATVLCRGVSLYAGWVAACGLQLSARTGANAAGLAPGREHAWLHHVHPHVCGAFLGRD